MATTLDDLEERVAALEEKLERLVARNGGNGARPTVADSPLERWLAEHSAKVTVDLAALRREMGIPADLPQMTAEEVQQLMLAEGVRPEDCILSSEIIRIREETRP